MVAFVSRWFQVHLLDGLLLLFNLILDLLDLCCDLFDESFHDGVLLIQTDKHIQQLLALILHANFSNPDFLSYPVKALFDLSLLHNAFLVLVVNARILLLLNLYLFLILLYLLLKLLQMLFFYEFWLNKLFEPNIVLDFIVQFGAVLFELFFLNFSLLFEVF